MKLLFDQNLSPRLIKKLANYFPESKHVQDVGLDKASDAEIWRFARENNFCIVSKDNDFSDHTEVFGFPPKVIWIHKENCSTAMIESILSHNAPAIKRFETDSDNGALILF